LKDLDLIKAKEKFKIDGETKKKLLDTIKADAKFFQRCEIIDYSLLIGIHQRSLHVPPQGGMTNNSVYLNTEQSDNNSPLQSQHLVLNTFERHNSNTSIIGPLPIN
jgi:hypothetical protein